MNLHNPIKEKKIKFLPTLIKIKFRWMIIQDNNNRISNNSIGNINERNIKNNNLIKVDRSVLW